VLPSLATCIAIPAAPGCSVVVPAVQSTTSTPVGQALNMTANIINTVSTTVSTTASQPVIKAEPEKDASQKKEDTKEATKEEANDKVGVKNEPPPPKTFCN
jgi:hypothetical protein